MKDIREETKRGRVKERYGIDSLWGAFGSIFVLQAYALFLLYSFVAAIRNIPSSLSVIEDLLGNLVAYFVGSIFLSIFVYAQGKMIDNLIAFLKTQLTLSKLLKEFLTIRGIIRFLLTLASIYLYLMLFLGKIDLGFPVLNIYISLAYQLFLFLVGYLFLKIENREIKTEERYVSAFSQIITMFFIFLAGCVFYGASIMMYRQGIPVYWIFQCIGATFFMFVILSILTNDIKGEVKKMPVKNDIIVIFVIFIFLSFLQHTES